LALAAALATAEAEPTAEASASALVNTEAAVVRAGEGGEGGCVASHNMHLAWFGPAVQSGCGTTPACLSLGQHNCCTILQSYACVRLPGPWPNAACRRPERSPQPAPLPLTQLADGGGVSAGNSGRALQELAVCSRQKGDAGEQQRASIWRRLERSGRQRGGRQRKPPAAANPRRPSNATAVPGPGETAEGVQTGWLTLKGAPRRPREDQRHERDGCAHPHCGEAGSVFKRCGRKLRAI